jgi:hypothetical protein
MALCLCARRLRGGATARLSSATARKKRRRGAPPIPARGSAARIEFLNELHDRVTRQDLCAMAAALSLPVDAAAVDAAVAERTEGAMRNQPSPVAVGASLLGGLGVFAARDLPRGTVLALYPGRVVPPELMRQRTATMRNALRAHAASLFDRVVRDGRARRLAADGSNPYAMMAADGSFYDPVGFPRCGEGLAVGHLLNHPPRDVEPAVLSWPSQIRDPALRRHLPNEAVGGAAPGACLPMLALADVAAGSELVMDYRFDLALDAVELANLPAWYAPVERAARN